MQRVLVLVLGALLILAAPDAARAQGFSVTLFPTGPALQVACPFDGVEVFAEGAYARESRALDGVTTSQQSELALGGGGRFFFKSMGGMDLYATGGLTWLFPDGLTYDSGNRFHAGAAAILSLGPRWSLVAEVGLAGETTREAIGERTTSRTSWSTYSGVGIRIEL